MHLEPHSPRIQLSLRIGWLEVQPIEGTQLEDHCGKQSFSSVEWFNVASLRVSPLSQLCDSKLRTLVAVKLLILQPPLLFLPGADAEKLRRKTSAGALHVRVRRCRARASTGTSCNAVRVRHCACGSTGAVRVRARPQVQGRAAAPAAVAASPAAGSPAATEEANTT